MPVNYAELEIGLSRLEQAGRYQVELRFDSPRDDAEKTPVRGVAVLDPEALLALEDSPGNEYGLALAKGLFADEEVRGKYGEFKAAIEGKDDFFRVKLFVGRSAPELHRLRWELLTDPKTDQPFSTSERILFSRFGTSSDWRPVRLSVKGELRALVAVSSPSDLDCYGLAPVDVEGEVARAREHLKGIQVTVAGHDAPLSLDLLVEGLRGDVDILYLVCHGGLHAEKGPLLYLQDEDGKAKVARGDELARRIGELVERPRLVVLASCESADTEQASTQRLVVAGQLVPLAPALAEAGVHAVLAMQGKVSMETVKTAIPVFFSELLVDGQIDRALAVARGKVRQRHDSWMPALFMRLKGGRIWYEPGFGEQDFKWDGLVLCVKAGQFTPIVGPGAGEPVYGSLRDAARKLAGDHGFPLAEHQRSELPLVTQYLRNELTPMGQRLAVNQQLKAQVRQTLDRLSPERTRALGITPEDADGLSLTELGSLVAQANRADPADPYSLLARLPVKVFITANGDRLLEEALAANQKEPDVVVFDWAGKTPNEKYGREPTTEAPLVFHAFGRVEGDDFMILTEDDHFDHLIAWTECKGAPDANAPEWIPRIVGYQTTTTSLLFLGFQPTDLSFRTLLRIIKSQAGSSQLKNFPQVGVQIDIQEDDLINAQRARAYLQDYFKKAAVETFAIFWGTAADFLQELDRRLHAS